MNKRLFDMVILAVLFVPASILMVLVAALTLLRDGSPVLFSQDRIGRLDRPFKLYKFRSMSNATDCADNLLPDSARLTLWGRFLRTTSLDELPQLWNVLTGDMSLVGPRPLPVRYLPRYSPDQRRRHLVRPGITGWAQVHGRNTLTWQQKFDLDIWYVDHRSFGLDIRVLGMTAVKVIRRIGISQDGFATMPEFLGEIQGDRS
jgi:sugar transferase EpsL